MAFEYYIRNGSKRLRCGFTTGTCAALAASAAAQLLFSGRTPAAAAVMTPKGIRVEVPVYRSGFTDKGAAWCSVTKDAGDDIDVTDGLEIVAAVSRIPASSGSDKNIGNTEMVIDGGIGVGRVTKPGLDQPVGAAAINHVPRQMIQEAVEKVCRLFDEPARLHIEISVPEGEAAAEKTFNPNLGILGGISVLGTSGIVEPMSEKALVDTIEVELKQAAAFSEDLILIPGNYGKDYLATTPLAESDFPVVQFSNFLGDTLDIISTQPFQRVLLVGHIGKMVKVAGGIMNTHSRWADCRREIFCAYAAVEGASTECCRKLMEAATTDACLDIIIEETLQKKVMADITRAIQKQLDHRLRGSCRIGAVIFSNVHGLLGVTEEAEKILAEWGVQTPEV